MRKLLLVVIMAGVLLSGCVYVDMKIQNKPVQGIDISKMKRFSFVNSGDKNDELEKRLFTVVRSDLESKGYTYDESSPEFIVLVRYGSRSVVERGVSYDHVRWGYNYLDKDYSDVNVASDGNSVIHQNQVKIFMIIPGSVDNPTFLWRSSASSSDREGVGIVGSCLVKGALSHFPGEAGDFREKVHLNSCKN